MRTVLKVELLTINNFWISCVLFVDDIIVAWPRGSCIISDDILLYIDFVSPSEAVAKEILFVLLLYSSIQNATRL